MEKIWLKQYPAGVPAEIKTDLYPSLVALLDATPPRRAAWLAWCYGVGWLCAAVWWLFISMHRYGGLPAPLAALAVAALAGALSLYLAGATALVAVVG